MRSSELASKIWSCLSDGYDDEEGKEEVITAIYNELSQLDGDSVIRLSFEQLCDRIEELEE